MFKTFTAYKVLIPVRFWHFLFIALFVVVVLLSSYYVFGLKEEILDSLLSILSILFPLIAGFLTFGRETLKKIKDEIAQIIANDQADEGDTVPNSQKRKKKMIRDLSSNFLTIVSNTFIVSFILIVFILVAKFNNYAFLTESFCEPISDFVARNWLVIGVKIIFFFLVYTMLLNTIFVVIYIFRISKHDLEGL